MIHSPLFTPIFPQTVLDYVRFQKHNVLQDKSGFISLNLLVASSLLRLQNKAGSKCH